MSTFKRVITLVAILAAALVCYTAGFGTGALIFFVLGMLLEYGFWFGLFRWGKNKGTSLSR